MPLEEDEYFVADMIGMKVMTEDGTEFGTLSDVMETGANDVYVIDSKEHGEVLMPAIKECVLNVDMESGIITVHLMSGLILRSVIMQFLYYDIISGHGHAGTGYQYHRKGSKQRTAFH